MAAVNKLLADHSELAVGAEGSSNLLQDVQKKGNDVSSKRYANALVSATVASLSSKHVLNLLAWGFTNNLDVKDLKETPNSNSLQVVLVAATNLGSITGIKLFIDRGADVNGAATLYSMPLHAATFGGHTTAMKLLHKGEDPKNEDLPQRRTPLHYAALLLTSAGINPDALDILNETPLYVAITQGHAK